MVSKEECDGPCIVTECTIEDYAPNVKEAMESEEKGELRHAWYHYGVAYDLVYEEFSRILESLEDKIEEIEQRIADQRPDGRFLYGLNGPVRYCCEDLKRAIESEEFGIDFEDSEYVVIVTPEKDGSVKYHHECPFCGKGLDQI